jgi:4-hydroxy-2-oxoglutarate aldolase
MDAILAATREVKHEATVTTVFAPVTRRMKAPVQEPAVGSATFVTAESLAGGAAVAVAPPKPAIKTRTKSVGFQVMAAGRVRVWWSCWRPAWPGAMPALAACAPQGCYEAYAAFKDGDPALAAEKEQRLLAADALLGELGMWQGSSMAAI